jgi:hypothetical protein
MALLETVDFKTERASDVLIQFADEPRWHIIQMDFRFYNIQRTVTTYQGKTTQ